MSFRHHGLDRHRLRAPSRPAPQPFLEPTVELPSTQPATAQGMEVTRQLSQPPARQGLPTESVEADPACASALEAPETKGTTPAPGAALWKPTVKLQSLTLHDYRVHTV